MSSIDDKAVCHAHELEEECENLRVALEDAEDKLASMAAQVERLTAEAERRHAETDPLQQDRGPIEATLARSQEAVTELEHSLLAEQRQALVMRRDFESKIVDMERSAAEGRRQLDVLHGLMADEASERRFLRRELRAIIATIPDAVITADADGCIRAFSPAAERMFGWPAKEIVGKDLGILMPSPLRQRHRDDLMYNFGHSLARAAGRARVTLLHRKSGETFPADVKMLQIELPGRRQLLTIVHELTASGTTKHAAHGLQAALFDTMRLDRYEGVSSAIAHEVNQPLAAIVTYLETARALAVACDPIDRTALKEALDKASKQASYATDVVRHMRALGKGRRLTWEQIDVNELVEQSAALVLINPGSHGVALHLDLAADLPPVRGARVQLQEVLLNLARNAVEAMARQPDGALTLTTRHARQDTVEITLADNGPGIPGHVTDRLFRPFVTTKEGGTGIGLPLCKAIIEAHGGRIWVSPGSAKGTVVHFALPAAALEGH